MVIDIFFNLFYQEFTLNSSYTPPEEKTHAIPLLDSENASERFVTLQNPKLGQKLLTVEPLFGMQIEDGPHTIDPAAKLWSILLSSLKSGKDLKDVKLPDDTPLVKAGASDADLEEAAKAIQMLYKARDDIKARK